MLDYKFNYPLKKTKLVSYKKIIPYLKKIDSSRWYSNFGPLSDDFKSRLSKKFHVHHNQIELVCNATQGLSLAIQTLNIPTNTYCAVPSLTFPATISAITHAGLKPYFIDIDPINFMVTIESILKLKKVLGSKLSTVIPVSFFGKTLNLKEWERLQKKINVKVIIDSAWSFDNFQPSTLPQVISLHATKVLGIGEGGVVISKDKNFIKNFKKSINYGFTTNRDIIVKGTNAKMSEYTAAIGLASLDEWDKRKKKIHKITNYYISKLKK